MTRKQKPLLNTTFRTPSKWTSEIGKHLGNQEENINVKMVDINKVILDERNARTINLSRDEIFSAPKISAFSSWDMFCSALEDFFPDKEKQNCYLSLAELAQSIQSADKLINPITVYMEGFNFRLIAGHRRTLAHIIMDSPQIAAKILATKPTPLEASILQLKENKDRLNLQLDEEIRNIINITDAFEHEQNTKLSTRKLKALLGIKLTQATWLLGTSIAYREDPIFKEHIQNRNISSLEIAYDISRITDSRIKKDLFRKLSREKKYSFGELKQTIKNTTAQTPSTKNSSTSQIKLSAENKVIEQILDILLSSGNFKSLNIPSLSENKQTPMQLKKTLHMIFEYIRNEGVQ